jgi:hypothetical protein
VRNLSYTLIASLMMNGLVLPEPALAAEQICATDSFTPKAETTDQVNAKCNGIQHAAECKVTRNALISWSRDYKKIAEDACQKRRSAISDIKELGQSASQEKVVETADAGIKGIQTLLEANEKILKKIPDATDRNIAALKSIAVAQAARPNIKPYQNMVTRLEGSFSKVRVEPEKMKSDSEGVRGTDSGSISGLDRPSGVDAGVQLETLAESQRFIRSLLTEKEKNEAAIRELTDAKENAARNAKNTETADTGTKSEGSGFSPMSLLPLAAPLAGLLMQQKAQQDSGLSDGLTNPTDPYGTAAPAPLAGTSLEPKPGGSSQLPGSTANTNPNAPDADMHMPAEAYAGAGESQPLGGDISRSGEGGGSSGMGALGSFSASSGGGSSDFSGASTETGTKERKPASASSMASEDGMIAAGGGGMAFGTSSSSDTESGDGMKDMLQDMEATLEDEPTGLFAEAEQSSSDDGVGPENSEGLFPRVRACYVRNLKKGFVLNGLGEKLPDSESH